MTVEKPYSTNETDSLILTHHSGKWHISHTHKGSVKSINSGKIELKESGELILKFKKSE